MRHNSQCNAAIANAKTAAMYALSRKHHNQGRTSEYFGVSKLQKKWMAKLSCAGVSRLNSLYDSEVRAADAWDAAARKHRGALAHGGRNGVGKITAWLNFPTAAESAAIESEQSAQLQFRRLWPLTMSSISAVPGYRVKDPEYAAVIDADQFDGESDDPANDLFCEHCGKGDDEERMIICDGCDSGHHLYCLSPPLTHLPEGSWHCSKCTPKRRREEPAPPKDPNVQPSALPSSQCAACMGAHRGHACDKRQNWKGVTIATLPPGSVVPHVKPAAALVPSRKIRKVAAENKKPVLLRQLKAPASAALPPIELDASVDKLRKMCNSRGLRVRGTKDELVQRLNEWIGGRQQGSRGAERAAAVLKAGVLVQKKNAGTALKDKGGGGAVTVSKPGKRERALSGTGLSSSSEEEDEEEEEEGQQWSAAKGATTTVYRNKDGSRRFATATKCCRGTEGCPGGGGTRHDGQCNESTGQPERAYRNHPSWGSMGAADRKKKAQKAALKAALEARNSSSQTGWEEDLVGWSVKLPVKQSNKTHRNVFGFCMLGLGGSWSDRSDGSRRACRARCGGATQEKTRPRSNGRGTTAISSSRCFPA